MPVETGIVRLLEPLTDFLPLAGGTMTGNIDMQTNQILFGTEGGILNNTGFLMNLYAGPNSDLILQAQSAGKNVYITANTDMYLNASLGKLNLQDSTCTTTLGALCAKASNTLSGCHVNNSANIGIVMGNWTTITFDTELFDTDNYHDLSTNPSRITIPKTGYYTIHSMFSIETSGALHAWRLLNQGNEIFFNRGNFYNSYGSATITGIYHLTIGDYIEVQVYSYTGPSTIVKHTDSPNFQIHYIGA